LGPVPTRGPFSQPSFRLRPAARFPATLAIGLECRAQVALLALAGFQKKVYVFANLVDKRT
jgi:hypothetical protein